MNVIKEKSIGDYCKIRIHNNYLVEVNTVLEKFDKPDVENVLKGLSEITKQKEHLLMVVTNENTKITLRALRHLASEDAMKYALAKAYVISSRHQKLMAGIFLHLFRPIKPVKYFNEPEAARQWLEELIR